MPTLGMPSPDRGEQPSSNRRLQTRGEDGITASKRLLKTLRVHGIKRIYANLGTDHTGLLEEVAQMKASGEADKIPELLTAPHEFAAMSAAHGAAITTGETQVVLVHVDVGTQNLGAALHNAYRARVPIVVIAGLAPVTEHGFVGSRNAVPQYRQDVFDQPGIVRQFCRWTYEYRPPEDPADVITRAIDRATSEPMGPVYVTATREALETMVSPTRKIRDLPTRSRIPGANQSDVTRITKLIAESETPLLITERFGVFDPSAIDTLVDFAELSGMPIVEHAPMSLCFPRDHSLHAGFNPDPMLEEADLVLVLDADIPWIPWRTSPLEDATVIQLDPNPSKPDYPKWDFSIDMSIQCDPVQTLSKVVDHMHENGTIGEECWHDPTWRDDAQKEVSDHERGNRLTPAVLSRAIHEVVDRDTILLNDATTSAPTVLTHVPRSIPGTYYSPVGTGLGWGVAAAIGVKIERPEERVIATVGDGGYVFGNPTACAWLADAYDAPVLTIVYNNSGWNAVRLSTQSQHPDGAAASEGVPGSTFARRMELSRPATVVDAYTTTIRSTDELKPLLSEAVAAVDAGQSAVVDVHVEPVP